MDMRMRTLGTGTGLPPSPEEDNAILKISCFAIIKFPTTNEKPATAGYPAWFKTVISQHWH